MRTLMHPAALLLAGLLAVAGSSWASEPLTLNAQGQIQVAFTPGDDAGAMIVQAIAQARRQVLVQTFSFTHKAIAQALIDARRRGIDVQVLADPDQAEKIRTSLIDHLAANGVPVWFDGQHTSAHNKVMILDVGLPSAAVITGSFNFTQAAQYRNAENVLLLRGNPNLTEAYAANWRRHRSHSQPYRR